MGKVFRDFSRRLRAPFNKSSVFRKLEEFHSQKRTLDELVEWGMNLGTSGLFRIDSVQKKSEILALVQKVSDLEPKNILEIGTCNGGTLFMWANLAKSKVVTCDLFKNNVRQEIYSKFPPPGSGCEVRALIGDSHDEKFREVVFDQFEGEKVDFLFIDGDHSEKGVEADFHNYKSLVRDGGIVAFHDILQNQPVESNQVYYFWNRIKDRYRHMEFVDDQNQCGFGIGIIYI